MILIPVYTYLKINGIKFLEPYRYGVFSLGLIVYYIGTLIRASFHNNTNYYKTQMFMIVSLLLGMFGGTLLGINAMFNVAITFTVIYIVEKISEFKMFRDLGVIAFFIFFICLYIAALWLNTNPEFIASILDP